MTRDEGGQAIVILVFSLFVILIFFGSLFDIGTVIPHKIRVQNAADAAARAAALWQARGLNLIGNCNVLQVIMMFSYVMPFEFSLFSPDSADITRSIVEMTEELHELQDMVACSFPLIGILSASMIARDNGAAPVTASRLRQAGLNDEGGEVDQALMSDPVFAELNTPLYAFPLARHRYDTPLTLGLCDLGVRRLEPLEVKEMIETVVAVNPEEFSSFLFDYLPKRATTVVSSLPILFFGFLEEGDILDVTTRWTREEAVRIDTHAGPVEVLTRHGKAKCVAYLDEIYAGNEENVRSKIQELRRTIRVEGTSYWVIPVIGPMDRGDLSSFIASRYSDLTDWIVSSIYLAWKIARNDEGRFIFLFYGPDQEFWTKRTGTNETCPDTPGATFVTWGPEKGVESLYGLFQTDYSRVFSVAQASPCFKFRPGSERFMSANEDGNMVYDAAKCPFIVPQFRSGGLEKVDLPDSCSLRSRPILH
jgi:hypothetical protein